jgi:hypothetical protein
MGNRLRVHAERFMLKEMNEAERDMMAEREGAYAEGGSDTMVRPEAETEPDAFTYLDATKGSDATVPILRYLFTKDAPDGGRTYLRMIYRKGEDGKFYRMTEEYTVSAGSDGNVREWYQGPVPSPDIPKWEPTGREEPSLEFGDGFTRPDGPDPAREWFIDFKPPKAA